MWILRGIIEAIMDHPADTLVFLCAVLIVLTLSAAWRLRTREWCSACKLNSHTIAHICSRRRQRSIYLRDPEDPRSLVEFGQRRFFG